MYSASITSEVRNHKGLPALFINGEHVPGAAYITYITPKNCYRDFSEAGYRLFSMPIFFATRGINAFSGIPAFAEGIFENRKPDFSILDREVRRILDACPNAMIFPRVNMSLPQWWDEENPEELSDFSVNNGPRRTCFASDKWAEETKRMLKMTIEHISNADYVDHICGYQLSGGNTEEWFSFDGKGSDGKRSQEKFRGLVAAGVLDDTRSAYLQFLSQVVADRICEFAAYAKELTDRKLIIGSFYGYTLDCVEPHRCHCAMKTVLNCPDIDFLCSPLCYEDGRPAGRDHASHLAVDSLKLHGKLYFSENDTRTDLAGPPFDLPYYQASVWTGPPLPISTQIMKMHFSRALCHGHAFWWFDMWGGWYARPEYMDIAHRAKEILLESMDKPMQSTAKIAVFVDEAAYCRIPEGNPVAHNVCFKVRQALGKTGIPYDIYLASDFEAVCERYKAYIFLVPLETETVVSAIDYASAAKVPFLVINELNYRITTNELRKFYASAGLIPWDNFDTVVFENESYLFLHACQAGVHHVPGIYRDTFTGETVENEIALHQFQSILLEKLSS